jgi:hypothetical protein
VNGGDCFGVLRTPRNDNYLFGSASISACACFTSAAK